MKRWKFLVRPAAYACARRRPGASLRSTPAARADGLDAGSAHARPGSCLDEKQFPTPAFEGDDPSRITERNPDSGNASRSGVRDIGPCAWPSTGASPPRPHEHRGHWRRRALAPPRAALPDAGLSDRRPPERLLWVGRERKAQTLEGFFDWFGAARSASLYFVCSDMCKPYLTVVAERARQAMHVLDRARRGTPAAGPLARSARVNRVMSCDVQTSCRRTEDPTRR